MNKTVIIFVVIVIIGFLGIFFLTGSNFLKENKSNITTEITPKPTKQMTQNNIQQNASPSPSLKPSEKISANKAVIKTGKGNIELQLYPQDAPKTVTNFATLAKNGFYNNLTFHRVEPGFVIQGGDPNGNGTGGSSIYGDTFEDELNPQTESYKEGYKEGVLAMANRGPNTNSSQFFIMLADTPLPHNYTIFGKVTLGIEVVKKIQPGDKIISITPETIAPTPNQTSPTPSNQ